MNRQDHYKHHRKSLYRIFGEHNLAYHHVIPLYAGGAPASWNLVGVSHSEHYELHRIRYEIWGDRYDLSAMGGAKAYADLVKGEVKPAPPVKSKRELYGKANVAPEVSQALFFCMIWRHKDGYKVIITPNSGETMHYVTEKILRGLPENHPDRGRILKNKTSANYLRSVIITKFPLPHTTELKHPKESAYNFVLEPYVAGATSPINTL